VFSAPADAIAWCQWQLGELDFAGGDYRSAEQNYRQALVTSPGYPQGLASLGRVRAAQGDRAGAIADYEQAVRRFPDPAFLAALGDLYSLIGREKDAKAQFELVERIAAMNGARSNRQFALFCADHDVHVEDAYQQAVREYAERKDIYGADAVAWTALKSGRLTEAQRSIRYALRLSTRDARLFYHAGMIARASGDIASARDYLRRALQLGPSFDPLQSVTAQNALSN
jgi:tetratricopeptide (TPR) repeat protein